MNRFLPYVLGVVGVLFFAFIVLVAWVMLGDDDVRAFAPAVQQRAAQAPASCTPDAFEVISKTGRIEAKHLVITSEVRNDNAMACGVQVSIETFDAKGARVGVSTPWPAGSDNIPAGGTRAFDYILSGEETRLIEGGTYTVAPLRARAW